MPKLNEEQNENNFIILLFINPPEYTRLRESQAAAGEGPSGGSVEYSEYRIWSQAVGGMQHGRITALQAELEQVKKVQTDWQVQFQAQIQMQMQAQHNQLLDEMQKMRDQLSEKEVKYV
ncbi:hypothetical protein M5K25_006307 [Dendrobium thyrsiflorum]|uniref:Uncharacterized protein n=1 Tax=Dendrobium thyrsiflorum TaxID=117978 RepID=A0ABD0VI39_DENTH